MLGSPLRNILDAGNVAIARRHKLRGAVVAFSTPPNVGKDNMPFEFLATYEAILTDELESDFIKGNVESNVGKIKFAQNAGKPH